MQTTKEALLARLRGEKADFIPEIWREFIKPTEKRYAERIHEYGMIYMHHSCGFIQQIIPDLVEIRAEVRSKMDRYVNRGRYIPFIIPNSERVLEIYADEVRTYGRQIKIG